MGDEHSIIELTVPAGDVDEAVARVCDEWGVTREAVQVDQLGAAAGQDAPAERVLLRITLLAPGAESDFDDDESLDPELEQARSTLQDLLEHMHVRAEVVAGYGQQDPESDGPAIVLDVRGDDLDPLIGRHGETLTALQYITRLILSKQFSHNVDLVVDVQGHKQRREEQLRRMAHRMAEQAAERQRVMSLEPMPANERRIIHLELRDHPDVTTESVGDGDRRKVTIVPKKRDSNALALAGAGPLDPHGRQPRSLSRHRACRQRPDGRWATAGGNCSVCLPDRSRPGVCPRSGHRVRGRSGLEPARRHSSGQPRPPAKARPSKMCTAPQAGSSFCAPGRRR